MPSLGNGMLDSSFQRRLFTCESWQQHMELFISRRCSLGDAPCARGTGAKQEYDADCTGYLGLRGPSASSVAREVN
eukprot:scaffold537422_cov45-Prasinocladus_malaysianus.AAC.1